MVSFKPQGRLGNFLFCAAATIAYATKHGIKYSMPSKTNDEFWNPIYLQNLVNPFWQNGQEDIVIKEHILYKFDELPFDEKWRDKQIVLKGYFQNPQYFEEYRNLIIGCFGFDWNMQPKTVSVHIRRGDYLQLKEKHPEITVQWIENAMDMFPGHTFNFFSDDMNWCEETFKHRGGKDCNFMRLGSSLNNLIGISNCEHHINSASTFSWMGAWLNKNPNKVVVVPKQWLMPSHSNQWTEEIVPKEWIRV